MTTFKRGDKVIDLDGRNWTIQDVHTFNGGTWCDCRRYEFGRTYDAVRYPSELRATP